MKNDKTIALLTLMNGDMYSVGREGVKEIIAEFYVNTPMSVEVFYENGMIDFYPHHQIAKVVFRDKLIGVDK